MAKINHVSVVGGTHGNEFTGIYLLKHWQQNPNALTRSSFETETLFANPNAYNANKRYIDVDLNRQFIPEDLNNPQLANYEQSRAKVINQLLGPKGEAKTDFIIDLHNTTSNMGPTLILLQADSFNTKLAAYISRVMPETILLFENHCSVQDHAFLCSIAEQGVIVEIGPQPQSVLRHDVLDQMSKMTQHILNFIEQYNTNSLPTLPDTIQAYKYKETLSLPLNEHGERIGVVHKQIQDNDFMKITNGSPLFQLFNGETIYWEGDYEAYPHFINEAAYYDNNLAMSLAEEYVITVF